MTEISKTAKKPQTDRGLLGRLPGRGESVKDQWVATSGKNDKLDLKNYRHGEPRDLL